MSRLLGAACLGAVVTAAVAATVAAREYAPVHKSPTRLAASTSGRIMVKFKARSTTLSAATSSTRSGPQAASALGARLGMTLADGRVLGARTQVMTAQGVDSATLAAAAAKDSDVEWAEVDQRRFVQTAPNDPLYAANQTATTPAVGQWYLRAPDSTIKSAINMEPAWAITTNAASGTAASGSAIVIADVDTGITSHPDLSSKLFANGSLVYGYDFIGYSSSGSTALATANDGNLADPDPSDPGDWVTATENSTKGGPFYGCTDNNAGGQVAENSSWHGTQTAGILGAATNNGVGMASVGYGTMVVPVRALGKCGGFDSDIIAAATWAGGLSTDTTLPTNTHPARVINMSLGGTGACGSAYQDALTALRNARVFVVVAAGNDEGLAVDAPANCVPSAADADQTPVVIAVAGIRQAGTKVGFSDIGPQVTISAPAGNCVNTASSSPCLYPILTSSNTGTTSPVAAKYTTGGSDASLGTSFATPMVAGTVALMLAANPSLSNAQVIALLKNSATTFPTTSDSNTATFTVPTCTAPTSTVQDECICTTSTCGAGMLNAGAAVVAASTATPVATIDHATSTVVTGSSVQLSGSSSLPSSATYQWTVSSGAGVVSLANATSQAVTVTGAAVGTATITLTVTDAATGAVATSTATVTVTAATVVATITETTSTLVVGSSVQLSAASSMPSTATYVWSVTSGGAAVSLSGTTGSVVTATGLADGTATVQLVVTDPATGTSATSSVTLTVRAVPVAVITESTLTVAAGASIQLSGASSTPSGLTYKWALTDGGSFASVTNTTSSVVTVTGTAAGTATVTLTVTDATTGSTASSTAAVTVTGATATSGGTSSGGSGGGAMQPGWLVALGVAGLLLAPRRRRRVR